LSRTDYLSNSNYLGLLEADISNLVMPLLVDNAIYQREPEAQSV
jgi:hypothetical protein